MRPLGTSNRSPMLLPIFGVGRECRVPNDIWRGDCQASEEGPSSVLPGNSHAILKRFKVFLGRKAIAGRPAARLVLEQGAAIDQLLNIA